MSDLCACDYTLGNSGASNCPSLAKGARMLIAMNIYKEDGSKNSIPLATLKVKASMQALIDEAVRENRIYPYPKMVDVENTRADAVTQDFSDGSIAFIRKGIKSFVGYMKRVGYRFTGLLDENRRTEHGYIVIDEEGNFIFLYDSTDATNAYPIPVDPESFHVDLQEHVTGTSIQLSKIQFNWAADAKDKDLRVLEKPSAYNPLTLKGLIDTTVAYTSISTTGFTATIEDANGCPIKGLLIGDFALAETSPTPGAVSISSVTETSDGVYDFVFPAESSADVLELTPSRANYDWSGVVDEDITIP